jgi:putative transposase
MYSVSSPSRPGKSLPIWRVEVRAGFWSYWPLFKRSHKTESRYQVWEEGSHPQLIESEIMMRQKLDYIHQNPVKRGYVDQPEHWRYSSARNYAGQEGLIEVMRVW